MSKFFTKTLAELLVLKKMTIDQYFEELTQAERKSFFQHHKDVIKSKANMRHFVNKRLELLMPFIEEDPDDFSGILVKHQIKVGIATAPSSHWSATTRKRIITKFHYTHPELTDFKNGADIKAWFTQAPVLIGYTSIKYMLTEVVPHHAKNPACAFGAIIRGTLASRFIPQLTESDFDVLYSDGDTLINELFNEARFKECIRNGWYPTDKFVQVLELNCTLAALEKDRSSRHSKTVAKNLKRAKLLLEIKKNSRS
jgi:hypothetical protein